MSFQAYIDNIQKATGKTPADFRAIAEKKGLTGKGVTATKFVDWLGADFGLGRGHAMAIWAVFKKEKWVDAGGVAKRPAKTTTSPPTRKK